MFLFNVKYSIWRFEMKPWVAGSLFSLALIISSFVSLVFLIYTSYPRFVLCWIISNESCSVNVYSRRRNESWWQEQSGKDQYDERGGWSHSNIYYPCCWIHRSTQHHLLRSSQDFFVYGKNQRCSQVQREKQFVFFNNVHKFSSIQ